MWFGGRRLLRFTVSLFKRKAGPFPTIPYRYPCVLLWQFSDLDTRLKPTFAKLVCLSILEFVPALAVTPKRDRLQSETENTEGREVEGSRCREVVVKRRSKAKMIKWMGGKVKHELNIEDIR